jgi:hypothetical protein
VDMFITLALMLFVVVWFAAHAIAYLLEDDEEPWVPPEPRRDDREMWEK